MFSLAVPCIRTVLAAALTLPLLTAQAYAQPRARASTSPFQGLSGSWTGSGTVILANGAQEQIRCRARYEVDAAGNALRQELRCASASYNFGLSSDVRYQAGTITGQWTETTRNTGGTVSGSVQGAGQIHAVVDGTGFSATLSVVTQGNRQSVQLLSRGREVTQVSITLRRT
jgi:hypothetical protein